MNTKEILQGIKDWAAPKVIYDISAAHNNTKYTDLSDALGTNGGNIPQECRKGGITVRYVRTSDNKYVQYRLMATSFSTTPSNWQGVDDEPTAESNNLVKSGGIFNKIYGLGNERSSNSLKKGYFTHNGQEVSNYDFKIVSFDVTNNDFVEITTMLRGEGVHLWELFNGDSFVRNSTEVATTTMSDYTSVADVREGTVLKVNCHRYDEYYATCFAEELISEINKEKINLINSEYGDLVNKVHGNENILDPSSQVFGYWDESGNFVNDPRYVCTSDLLPIDYQKSGKIYLRQTNAVMAWISYFDSERTFISQVAVPYLSGTLDIPIQAKFYCVSAGSASVRDLTGICLSYTELSGFVSYYAKNVVREGHDSKESSELIDVMKDVAVTMPFRNNILPDAEMPGYWDNSNNGEYVPNNNYKCTPDFIEINSIQLFYKNGYSLDGYILFCMLCYDSSKSYLGYLTQTAAEATFDLPQGTRYIKVWISSYGSQVNIWRISMSYISLSYTKYNGYDFYDGKRVIMPARTFSSLYGKRIVNFGDSIFHYGADDNYAISNYLQEYIGAECKNVGFGGTRAAVTSDGYGKFSFAALADAIVANDWSAQDAAVVSIPNFASQLARIKAVNWSTTDIITVAYGTNDYTASIPLDNNTKTSTGYYADALRYGIEKLLTRFENLRIFLLTPTFRTWDNGTVDSNTRLNGNNDKLTDFVAKMQEVGLEYNIDVVDNYNIGITKLNVNWFIPRADGTHHNIRGKKLIAAHIAKEIY